MDFNIREQIERDIDNTYLVEAGAGTGKTTLLVARILQLIGTGRTTLDKIVAISFTEKSATELKLRIHQTIEQRLSASDNSTSDYWYRALREIEQAQITTIHGFCSNILREYAVAANVDPNFTVVNEGRRAMIYRRVWENWLWETLHNHSPVMKKILSSGVHLGNIADMAQQLTMHRDVFIEFSPKLHTIDFARWRTIFADQLQKLTALKEHCRDYSDRGYQRIVRLEEQWNHLRTLDDQQLERRLVHELVIRIEGNQKAWHPKQALKEVKEIFRWLRQESEKLRSDLLHNLTHQMLAWLLEFCECYQQQKRLQSVLDFEDLLICTRNMLKYNLSVRQKLQQNYNYLFVDEFQDTDPLQVEILFFLAEGNSNADNWRDVELEPGKIFFVGDPKQSIYRFRRADIEIYEEVKAKLGTKSCVNIQQNFRSRPQIINWVNDIFEQLIQPPQEGRYQPRYSPLHPALPQPSWTSLQFLLPPKKVCKEQVLRMQDIVNHEAESIAHAIEDIHRQQLPITTAPNKTRPVQFSDIALLIRRFSYADVFAKALTRYHIPYQIMGSKSYYQRLEIKSLLSLLRTVADPCDEAALVATLRSPIFSIADADVFRYKYRHQTIDYRNIAGENSLNDVLQLLAFFHQRIDTIPHPQLLAEIFAKTDILLTFLTLPQGKQRVANLRKMISIAHSLLSLGMHNFRSFVDWVSEMEVNEQNEAESYIEDEDHNAVRIFSIHRAKGLEFPVLFLGDLGAQTRKTADILIDRNQKNAAVRLRGRVEIKTQNYAQLAEMEKKKIEAEEKRLLYVAMTRARDYLIVPLAASGYGYLKWLQPFIPQATVDTFPHIIRETPLVSTSTQLEFCPLLPRTIPEADFDNAWQQQRQKWSDRRKQALRWATIPATKEWRLPGNPLGNNDCSIDSLVHRVLARFQPLAGDDMFIAAEMEILLQRELRQNFFSAAQQKKARHLINNAINSPLLMRAARSEQKLRAIPFHTTIEGIVVHGCLDLCFREKDRWFIIDYITENVGEAQIPEYVATATLNAAVYVWVLQKIANQKIHQVLLFFLECKVAHAFAITPQFLQQAREKLTLAKD